jgi:putative membrane protein
MKFLYTVLVNALAFFLASQFLEGFAFGEGWLSPIIAGLTITLLNIFVKPILRFLSFPVVFISGGLFLILINALILYLTEYLIMTMDIEGVTMEIDKLLTYIIAAIIFGFANWLIHWFLKD